MRITARGFIVAGLLAAAIALSGDGAAAASPPEVYAAVEGVGAGGERVLLVAGSRLTKSKQWILETSDDPSEVVGVLSPSLRTKSLVAFPLPAGFTRESGFDLPGTYRLRMLDARGVDLGDPVPVRITQGYVDTALVLPDSLDTGLRDDLSDADTLQGHDGDWYTNAVNIDAGTLDPARYRARDSLQAAGDVGTGSAQVAAGNHLHDDRYFTETELSSAGTLNTSTNPVDWSRLKNVPAAIASGYAAGTGLNLSANTFSVLYGSAAATAVQGNDSRVPPAPGAAGRILYSSGSAWAALSPGTDGQVLMLSGGVPSWGTGSVSAPLSLSIAGATATSAAIIGTNTATGSGVRGVGVDATGVGVYGQGMFGIHGVARVGGGAGVYGDGDAFNTYGVWGNTDAGSADGRAGVYGSHINGTGTGYGVHGYSDSSQGTGVWGEGGALGVYGSTLAAGVANGVGVKGESAYTGGQDTTYGVWGTAVSTKAAGVYAEHSGTGNGTALLAHLSRTLSTGDILVGKVGINNVARIDNTGKGYFNGGTATSGADVAESVAVDGPRAAFAPGDVLVIDITGTRRFALSRVPASGLVAGVFATRPGLLLRNGAVAGGEAAAAEEVPLAVVGIVPVKVCDEGGSIGPGDLLVTASLPGHAMKSSADPRAGTVLGKALGRLDRGTGVVEVLLGPAR